MKPYADTNFFSTLYLHRSEEAIADRLLENAISEGSEPLPVTWLLRLEMINSLERPCFLGNPALILALQLNKLSQRAKPSLKI